jgi:hypothetical protein
MALRLCTGGWHLGRQSSVSVASGQVGLDFGADGVDVLVAHVLAPSAARLQTQKPASFQFAAP